MGQPVPLTTLTTNLENCIVCSDVGTPWMQSVGNECPSSYLLGMKCNINRIWKEGKFCQHSCYTNVWIRRRYMLSITDSKHGNIIISISNGSSRRRRRQRRRRKELYRVLEYSSSM